MKFHKKNVKLEGCDKREKYVTYWKRKKKKWLEPGSNRGSPHWSPT